jgi:hypothetical protein
LSLSQRGWGIEDAGGSLTCIKENEYWYGAWESLSE